MNWSPLQSFCSFQMVFLMRIWLLAFHLLLPCISVYGYIEKANTMVPCGATGGYCKVNCHSGYNGDYGGYFEVCDLVEINYSGVSESETGLDLSSLSLNLASIPSDCVDGVFPKHRIQSLILAHNLFYEEYDPSSISLSPLRDFIANFPNLRSLNLSNITTGFVSLIFLIQTDYKNKTPVKHPDVFR